MKDEKTTTKPTFDPEVPPREGFIFYRTFYEALASMKNRARLHLYDVIMRYALYGEEPTDLNGEQMRTFILTRPQLDANERKRQAKYKKKAIKKNNVHTVVVDEVHCLTEWGSEFRPMYRNIGKFIKDLPSSPVVAAFSATVMQEDIPYIIKSLRMKNPTVHIGKLKRSNLSLGKVFVKTEAIRYGKVKKAILKYADKGKIIIYCTRVCDVEEMRDYLIEDCDIEADEIAICHSKLSNRAKQEQRFRSGKARIMIATSAFGMGVNIPDIRLIIVSQLPFSAASFYQMAGRAGRDGKRAKALLLWNDVDFQMNLDIISHTDDRAVEAVNELYAICESSDDLHDAVIGCFAKGGE